MRFVVAFVLFAVASCSPAASGSSGSAFTVATTAASPSTAVALAVAVRADQLSGQWSFDRSCGLYDLVFTNDSVSYYDYSDQSHVVSYAGPYTIVGNHVVITVRRLDAQGAPSGDPVTYNLDITAPLAADLVGRFGLAGSAMREINAKQCPSEDRE